MVDVRCACGVVVEIGRTVGGDLEVLSVSLYAAPTTGKTALVFEAAGATVACPRCRADLTAEAKAALPWDRLPGGPAQENVRVRHAGIRLLAVAPTAAAPEVLPALWSCPVCGGHTHDEGEFEGSVDYEDYTYEVQWCERRCAVWFDGKWYLAKEG